MQDLYNMTKYEGPGRVVVRKKIFCIENNDYGARGVSVEHKQSVYMSPDEGDFGWEWQYNTLAEQGDVVLGFPEIIFGKKPWADNCLTYDLPKQLSDVHEVWAEFSISTQATGKYNTSFDIWLTSKNLGGPESITTEVMFWVQSQGSPTPSGRLLKTDRMYHDNREFELYQSLPGDMYWYQAWPCYTFVFKDQFTSGTINFAPYLSWLSQLDVVTYDRTKKAIDMSTYLGSVEFGQEIWSGEGQSYIGKYEVTVK